MSFVRHDQLDLQKSLFAAHYEFPRSQRLRGAFEWMITDYYSKASLELPFEARGVLLTGLTRIGKTTETRWILAELNDGTTLMPDGRPARIATVTLDGKISWKDLGIHMLRTGLRYPIKVRRHLNQRNYWEKVKTQAQKQGVVGIHYDECQHIFTNRKPEARELMLDSFKTLLKQPDWPFMLVLSGTGKLGERIQEEPQFAHLLRPVSFTEINVHRQEDLNELNSLCHAYAERAGHDFSELGTVDFYRRFSLACGNSWGIAAELMIAVLLIAHDKSINILSTEMFCEAFTERLELQPGFLPFSVDEYEELFHAQKMIELWSKSKESTRHFQILVLLGLCIAQAFFC